ncbi:(2Fe-2S) ferredoxin domain-containing protein [Sphingobium sufflavum]|uniref:(2Fe-2S) ferredoxin domain-containing protein n=1 Tax=Sphingobium sufflavum TaxID=1129547 RepID=UPI001F1B03F9|nr:(2Fe-2S) ferredoxin domain-containing protein [Sphingobium sufflavum]
MIIIARSAIAAAPIEEMRAAAAHVLAAGVASHASHASHAFTEQGEPALKERLWERIASGARSIVLVPLIVPMEPSFAIWIGKILARWEREWSREHEQEPGQPWPEIRLAPAPFALPQARDLLAAAVSAAGSHPQPARPPAKREGSIIPAQKRRVLVCHGAPCTAAGASLIWGHLRNVQARRSLRTQGEGMMSAKASCLGPCNLAPVVQVWPEGTSYGGVDEAGIDAIIDAHVLNGAIAEDYAYPADGRKHVLRDR